MTEAVPTLPATSVPVILRAPGYLLMRIAMHGGLATVGPMLGMAIGAWLER